MRDIRKLDNVFAIANEPTITVRQQAILINAGQYIINSCAISIWTSSVMDLYLFSNGSSGTNKYTTILIQYPDTTISL